MSAESNNGKRAFGYLRCSTTEQRESGLGLSAQRNAIESAAKREGLAVAEWFADEGVSGASTIDKRPADDQVWDSVAVDVPRAAD